MTATGRSGKETKLLLRLPDSVTQLHPQRSPAASISLKTMAIYVITLVLSPFGRFPFALMLKIPNLPSLHGFAAYIISTHDSPP